MSISTKHLALAVSILACMYTSAFALEFKDLTIDANSTPLPWLVSNIGGDRAMAGVGPVRPTHAAVIYLVAPGAKLPKDPAVATLSTGTGKSLSQEQRDLVSTGQGIVVVGQRLVQQGSVYVYQGWETIAPYLPNCLYVRIYGVGEEDTKKTVKAFIEALEANATGPLQEARRKLEECHLSMDRTREKIEETRVSMEHIVRNQGVLVSPEDISRMISTTEDQKNSLSIDVAGLNARIEAITKYLKTKENVDSGMLAKLQQMLIDHNIELAGVLAKLKATDAARDKAEQKYMLSLRLGELRKESDELRAQLMKAEQQREEAESNHRKAQDEMVHPQIFQNKATIYPVTMEK